MLTHLFRYGATRHRLRKGYVVSGPNAPAVIAGLGTVMASVGEPASAAVVDPTAPTVVWFDTGPVHVHTPAARAAVFARLSRMATAAATHAAQATPRCLLLPNAVRPTRNDPWPRHLCPDFHTLETEHPTEQEVLCNLFRRHLPVLIAVFGRAGAGNDGVEPIGSRLLSESGRHLAARYLASVGPAHLARVNQALRRDDGIDSLAAMDVLPVSGPPTSGVEVRAADGKALLSTAAAELLLYQALAMRARRVARAGDREPDVPQAVVERDRVRAIADGPAARLEVLPPKPLGEWDGRPQPRTGWRAFLDLIESLRYEFKALAATPDEIAPLVVGTGLRAVGVQGLATENDYLRDLYRQCAAGRKELAAEVSGRCTRYTPATAGELTARNAELFAAPTQAVRDWWQSWLAAEWPQPPLPVAKPPASPPRPPEPPPRAPAPPPKLAWFAQNFFDDTVRTGPKAALAVKLDCLHRYLEAGGPMELGDVLATLPPPKSDRVWPWLLDGVPVFGLAVPTWADGRAGEAAQAAWERFVIVEIPGNTPPPAVTAFVAGRPRGLELFRLDATAGGKPPAVVAFLVCPSPGGGS